MGYTLQGSILLCSGEAALHPLATVRVVAWEAHRCAEMRNRTLCFPEESLFPLKDSSELNSFKIKCFQPPTHFLSVTQKCAVGPWSLWMLWLP